jgi:hypothetical protein
LLALIFQLERLVAPELTAQSALLVNKGEVSRRMGARELRFLDDRAGNGFPLGF